MEGMDKKSELPPTEVGGFLYYLPNSSFNCPVSSLY